ncbi:hypothetical protein [Bacillus sp. REN10]|uniref:hypothetical protein n=1 Tax=Bacillus sp. REN10 TaxID=2782541 RepID=UPI00193BFC0B|nr:hypothetical protein [Bacillus sp. REN10]
MIEKLNARCKKVNDFFGVSVKLPNPRKNTLLTSSVVNGIVGIGLISYSVLSFQKWTAVLGGVSIISSIVLKKEAKKK